MFENQTLYSDIFNFKTNNKYTSTHLIVLFRGIPIALVHLYNDKKYFHWHCHLSVIFCKMKFSWCLYKYHSHTKIPF